MLFSMIYNEFFLERKSTNNLFFMFFFSVACFLLLLFSFPPAKIIDITIFVGFFWIVISFCSVKLIENSFAREKEYGIYDLLYSSSKDLWLLFLSKIVSFSLIMLVLQIIISSLYFIFTETIISEQTLFFLPLFLLSNFGLIGVGILIFLITNISNIKGFLFPLIFFPIIVPILVNASSIFLTLILEDELILYTDSWMILLTFALMSTVLGINLFGRLIKQ